MIQEFATYLTSLRGYSENTVRAYVKDLKEFVTWANKNIPEARWSTITRTDIDNYIIYQQKRGLKPATTNRQLASISGLYRYLQRQGHEITNPTKYESRRKIHETIPTTIPLADIKKAYKYNTGLKKAMIGILATTGIRIQELLDLTWEDINFSTNELLIHGKGSKERIVKTETEILRPWKELIDLTHSHGRIFFIGQRKAREILYEALRPYTRSKHLNPHTIRHTFATQLALNGENVTTIAKMLGHSNISTTQKYIDLSTQKTAHPGISLT